MKIIYCIFAVLVGSALDPVSGISQFYTSDKNNVFYIEDQPQYDWFEALTTCARMNMTLLTIESKAKSDEVNRLVKTTFGKNVALWVGGYAVGPSRKYTWITTGQEFTYTLWHGSNPDFYKNAELCAQIGWGPNMGWNDHVCTVKFGFICEYYWPRNKFEGTNRASDDNYKTTKYHNIALNFYKL